MFYAFSTQSAQRYSLMGRVSLPVWLHVSFPYLRTSSVHTESHRTITYLIRIDQIWHLPHTELNLNIYIFSRMPHLSKTGKWY